MESTPARVASKEEQAVGNTSLAHSCSPDSAYASFALNASLDNVQSTSSGIPPISEQVSSQLDAQSGCSQDNPVLDTQNNCSATEKWPGVRRVDFLRELQGLTPALSCILAHLSGQELGTVCRTSGAWRCACATVKAATKRWRQYIRAQRDDFETNRENLPSKKIQRERSEDVSVLTPSNSLSPHERATKSVAHVPKTRFQIFVEEAANLEEDEIHRPCPTCGYPSRVSRKTGEGVCKSEMCGRKLCPVYLTKGCNDVKTFIGSKTSRKSLRRL
ncbi:F-box only protein 43-like isoform X2 [Ornithodoros turicata]